MEELDTLIARADIYLAAHQTNQSIQPYQHADALERLAYALNSVHCFRDAINVAREELAA
jgi:hypothetical protein